MKKFIVFMALLFTLTQTPSVYAGDAWSWVVGGLAGMTFAAAMPHRQHRTTQKNVSRSDNDHDRQISTASDQKHENPPTDLSNTPSVDRYSRYDDDYYYYGSRRYYGHHAYYYSYCGY